MAYFTKRYHPPGTSPGTLTSEPGTAPLPLSLSFICYSSEQFRESQPASLSECRSLVQPGARNWLHVQGPVSPELLAELGRHFGLHALALEDVLNSGQRPKLDTYENHLFLVAAYPNIRDDGIDAEQVSLFLIDDLVISLCLGATDPFEPVRQRLRESGTGGRIRTRSCDYLLYALLDAVIDQGFPVLEDLGERLEDLEDELLNTPTRDTLRTLHHFKRELLLLRRALWPHREVVNGLTRDDTGQISEAVKPFLRDCYDHTVQIMELLESYRDITASMLDIYLSSVSYRLNDIMRVLTMISTVFIPLTFITGVYGMNFGNNTTSTWAMPELRWEYGYPLIWGIIVAVAAGILVYFRRKKWL
jgi:magnesium transporter